MKALPMLDHVMLWVAKMFTAATLFIFCLPFVMLVVFFLLELFQYLLLPHSAQIKPFYVFTLSIQQMIERPRELVDGPFALLIFASVRYLQSIYARVCLGLTSGFLVLCFGSATIMLFHTPHNLALFYWLGVTALLGFISLLWVSIRPPQNTKSKAPPFITDHPIPQSC